MFLAQCSGILLAKYSDACFLPLAMFPFIAVLFYRRELAKIIITACCVMVFAFFYYELTVPPRPASLPDCYGTQICGQIVEFPEEDPGRTILYIATEADDPYLRRFRVSLYFNGDFARGQTIRLQGDLEPVPAPRNPGAFDYAEYLAGEGVYYLGKVEEAEQAEILEPPGYYDSFINACRERALGAIQESLPPNQAATLIGMLLNDVSLIEPEDYDLYQKTGIIHLFSVSGLHTGFLILMMAWLGDLFRLRNGLRFTSTMAILLVYGAVAGWPVAVERSVLMAFLCLLAHYTGRSHQMINGLCLSAVLILAADPRSLFNLSFQLTFLATWGLVALFPELRRRWLPSPAPANQEARRLQNATAPGISRDRLETEAEQLPVASGHGQTRAIQAWKERWVRRVLEGLLLPLCAEITIIPLVAYHFNMISPWSLLTNILTVYTSGLAVILGFAALLAAIASTGLAGLFLYPAGLMVELIDGAVSLVAGLPFACIWVRSPSPGMMALYYGGGIFLYTSIYREWPLERVIAGAALMALVLGMTISPPRWASPEAGCLKIVFVDVGQGDCIYICTPGGRHLLVDGGGSEFRDVGRLTVAPFLKQEGVNRLDLVVNTHPDTDHVGGLQAVFTDFQVDYLGVPYGWENHPAYRELLPGLDWGPRPEQSSFLTGFWGERNGDSALFCKEEPVMWKLHAGQRIDIEEGLELRVLSPEAGSGTEDVNSSSVVLELRFGSFGLLLTGDIDAKVMDELVAHRLLNHCTVVKVPHHGSRNSLSAEFYQELRPHYAVIQAGQGNPFGHPSGAVLDLLDEQGVRVLRTDQEGAVSLITDGCVLQADSCLDPGQDSRAGK